MLHFKAEIIRLPDGERMPLLFRQDPYEPATLALMFVAFQRRYYRTKTILRDVRVLGWLYNWCYQVRKDRIDLEARLLRGQSLTPSEIEGFGRWLRGRPLGRYSPVRVLETHQKKRLSATPIQPTTLNNYLSATQNFLIWAIRRYHSGARGNIPNITDSIALTKGVFEATRLRGKVPPSSAALPPEVINAVFSIISSASEQNPFRIGLRLRNSLICETLYETGIRRGELLKLKVEDLVDYDNAFFIKLVRRPDDPEDWRRNEPAQKTLPRFIAISKNLYESLLTYIRLHRRPKRRGRPIKLSHSYLFVSERGFPLAESQINYIFSRIGQLLASYHPRLHPHAYRHSFCHMFLDHCVRVESMDEEAAKDRLRKICGWTSGSEMPNLYTAKRLQDQANTLNQQRVESFRLQQGSSTAHRNS